MNFPYLMLFCCIILSQTSSCHSTTNSLIPHFEVAQRRREDQIHHNASVVDRTNWTAINPKPWRSTRLLQHRHLKTVHGIATIIGWGVLTPIGIIAARYLRKQTDEWYTLHVVSHFSGFLLGTLGWGLGISIKSTGKGHALNTHGIIGTIIFVFSTLQPEEESRWRRWWVIYHNLLGYALAVVIIANIFVGMKKIENGGGSRRWEWIYGCVLGVLGVSTVALEVPRWLN